MPSAEHEPSASQPPSLYVRAARFRSERRAGRAYFQAQETLYSSPDSDLSAYRFLLNRVPYVTVLGLPPPEELDRTIRTILAAGEPTSLPADVLMALLQRRADQTRLGPWREHHYRPGRPL